MGADYYGRLLGSLYAGGKWILAAEVAAGATGLVKRMIECGAAAVMVVAGSEGTGPPLPEDVEVFLVGTTGARMMDGIRAFDAAIADPSPELCRAVDAFDPAGKAKVVSGFMLSRGELCGRPVYGGPRPEWKALEDKLIGDDLWDRAGIDRAPSVIVDAGDAKAAREARSRMEAGDGVVLVADNSEGWHGGGEYTRYVAPGGDWSNTMRFFSEHSRRFRVMPFLKGVPCSIHGLVAPATVLAFRPVEMLVYRRPVSDDFVYAGVDTVWDPPVKLRERMRRAARAVGELIREEVGYLGAFGIDGVCIGDRFLPTELNPRLTVGLGIQAEAAGQYPLGDINRAVITGVEVDLRLTGLEEEVVAGADTVRSGRWLRPVTHLTARETEQQPLIYRDSRWAPSDADGATAVMSFGPSAQGALVHVSLTPDHGLAAGASLAGMAAASFAVADEMWDTRIGDLLPWSASPR